MLNAASFQSQGNDTEPVTYHPFEILGYRFTDDGKYYVSKNIELKYGVSTPSFSNICYKE